MNKLSVAIAAAVMLMLPLLLGPRASEAAKKDCFVLESSEWKVCEPGTKGQGLVIEMKNICVETMQVEICLDRDDGTKDCKWFRNVPKNSVVRMESCGNTGNYSINACEDIKDCATPAE